MNIATKPAAPFIPTTAVRVLKIATCPSLSGKSTLTYHVGCAVNGEGTCTEDIHFRVVDNTNIGFFSPEWVPFTVIRGEFDKVPTGQTITSFLLHALFRGKSVNTPAFLFAVLKNEGLVQPAKDKQRQYERIDPSRFVVTVKALIAAKVELKWDEPVKRMSVKTGAKSAKTAKVDVVAANPTDKSATVKTKTAKGDAVIPKVAAKPTAKTATGVDIAEIVEVINAKVGPKPAEGAQTIEPKTKSAMPAKKAAAKAKS